MQGQGNRIKIRGLSANHQPAQSTFLGEITLYRGGQCRFLLSMRPGPFSS